MSGLGAQSNLVSEQLLPSVLILLGVAGAVWAGCEPVMSFFRRREHQYDVVLRRRLLMDVSPRAASLMSGMVIILLGLLGYGVFGWFGAVIWAVVGLFSPPFILRRLQRRRLKRLEDQLVGGIVTLASGVRAGLNLVQSMQLVGRDGPRPLRQEFAHMLREYEYGLPLEAAMRNSATRIGSGDFRLLFAALETHRQRGGDLGVTLDRIADSIREIQRLESRVESLTAQGRATARALGVMPIIVMVILYMIDPEGVRTLWTTDIGKLILLVIAALTAAGFLWIKKIVSIDV